MTGTTIGGMALFWETNLDFQRTFQCFKVLDTQTYAYIEISNCVLTNACQNLCHWSLCSEYLTSSLLLLNLVVCCFYSRFVVGCLLLLLLHHINSSCFMRLMLTLFVLFVLVCCEFSCLLCHCLKTWCFDLSIIVSLMLFLASQDSLEVMIVTHWTSEWLSVCTDFTEGTVVCMLFCLC